MFDAVVLTLLYGATEPLKRGEYPHLPAILPDDERYVAVVRTVTEYQQRWRDVMNPDCALAPWDEPLSPTACVIYEASRTLPMNQGLPYFSDFGDAVCFIRYHRIREELDTALIPGSDVAGLLPDLARMGWNWKLYRARYSPEELRRRRYEGERALDKLLARYVKEGYQPWMGEKLLVIVNTTLIDFELRAVYTLPDDLDALLAHVGNPLDGWPFPEGEAGIIFDLSAPGHREALAERLLAFGQ